MGLRIPFSLAGEAYYYGDWRMPYFSIIRILCLAKAPAYSRQVKGRIVIILKERNNHTHQRIIEAGYPPV